MSTEGETHHPIDRRAGPSPRPSSPKDEITKSDLAIPPPPFSGRSAGPKGCITAYKREENSMHKSDKARDLTGHVTPGEVPNMVRPNRNKEDKKKNQEDKEDYYEEILENSSGIHDREDVIKLMKFGLTLKTAEKALTYMRRHEDRTELKEKILDSVKSNNFDELSLIGSKLNYAEKEIRQLGKELKSECYKYDYKYFLTILSDGDPNNYWGSDSETELQENHKDTFFSPRKTNRKNYKYINKHNPEIIHTSNRYQTLSDDNMDLENENQDSESEYPSLKIPNNRQKRKASSLSPRVNRKSKKIVEEISDKDSAKESETEDMENNEDSLDYIKAKRTGRLPPFIVENSSLNYLSFKEVMKKENLLNDYRGKYLEHNGTYTIKPLTREVYAMIQNILDQNHAKYHTYSIPENRDIKVVIRKLPSFTEINTIESELEEEGFEFKKVIQMQKRVDGTLKKLPLFIVILPRTENNKRIYKLNALFNLKIEIQDYRRKSGLLQCFKCQGYFHTQAHCTHDPKCVKCAGPHLSSECPTPKGEKAPNLKCANCEGEHPASYRQCITYLQKQKEFESRKLNKRPPPRLSNYYGAKTYENRSYAEAAKMISLLQLYYQPQSLRMQKI